MTIRPNFPLTTAHIFALTITGRRKHVTRLHEIEQATNRLEAVTGCPREQAYRIAGTLGTAAAEGLVETVARSGVTLEQIADAIRPAKE